MAKKNHLEKERILDVAAELFGEKGYAATSIRDIAHGLNASIATLYYYFKNKEDLLFTIIETIGEDLLVALHTARDDRDDPLEKLRNMLTKHIELTDKKRSRVKVYVEEQHNLSSRFREIIYKQHRMIYETYVDQLIELHKLGLISSDPPSVPAFAMFGMVNWCYRWFKPDGGLSIDDVSQRLIDLVFYGILNPQESDLPGAMGAKRGALKPKGNKINLE